VSKPLRADHLYPYGKTDQILKAIGFNVETVQVLHLRTVFDVSGLPWADFCQYKNIKFQVWDLGGQSSIR